MTKPTIHMNGSGADSLMKGYREAMDAVRDAQDELSETRPSQRDYYPQSHEAWLAAIKEHHDRANKLQSVYDELLELAMHCNSIIEARRADRNERAFQRAEDPSGENPGL